MYIKNNKGISMISLILIVVIMIMLASITAYEAKGLLSITKTQAVATNLLLIQAKVRIINEQVVFEKDDEKKQELLVGTKLSENAQMLNEMKQKNIISDDENVENYYILSQENLKNMGLDTLNASDGYVVDYDTEEIIYVTGVENEDGVYLYKLSDFDV